MNIQDGFPLGWTGWISLQYKGLSGVSKQQNYKKKKSMKMQNVAPNIPWTLVYSMRAEMPSSSSAGNTHVEQLKFVATLFISTNEHESPIDFEITIKLI